MTRVMVVLLIMLCFVSSCSRTIEHYEFSSESIHIDGGSINVSLHGEFREHDSFFKRKTVKGNPYSLVITYIPESNFEFCIGGASVRQEDSYYDIRVQGSECGKEVNFHEFSPGTRIYSFENVDIDRSKSITVTLRGKFESEGETKEYSVDLDNEFRMEKRNDFLDMIGSA